jgi:hypothetical protein
MTIDPGLCATCVHARIVKNDRGGFFVLCHRSRSDPGFRKYPPLPVLRCHGFMPQHKPSGT